jgi:MoaA/NifB/PqqE/SkfB family radical SAM enzyme
MALPLSAASRKARLAKAFLRGSPVHCTWQLSPRCEALCHLCEHRSQSSGDDLDTAGCQRVAEELGRSTSLLVSFTGSEPFLRSDLVEIVRATAAWHFPLLVTNGCLVTAARARQVWQAGLEVATVALEDGAAEGHDAATGLVGSHARALAALEGLSRERTRASQRVNVRVRLRGPDLGPLERALAVAEAHGASVTVEAGVPLPRLEPAEADALASGLRRLKRAHRSLRSADRDLASFGAALAGGVKGCVAGRAFFNVDHHGRISKCLEHRGPAHRVGRLPEDRVEGLLPLLRERHARNECRDCWYASRAEIEGLYTLRGFLSGVATLVRA